MELDPTKTYEYKFVVDGIWLIDSTRSRRSDEIGNVNNYLAVNSDEGTLYLFNVCLVERIAIESSDNSKDQDEIQSNIGQDPTETQLDLIDADKNEAIEDTTFLIDTEVINFLDLISDETRLKSLRESASSSDDQPSDPRILRKATSFHHVGKRNSSECPKGTVKKRVSWIDEIEPRILRKQPSWILGEGIDTLLVTEEIVDSSDEEEEFGEEWKIWEETASPGIFIDVNFVDTNVKEGSQDKTIVEEATLSPESNAVIDAMDTIEIVDSSEEILIAVCSLKSYL